MKLNGQTICKRYKDGLFAIVIILIGLHNSLAQVDNECGFTVRINNLQKVGEIMGRPILSGTVQVINTTNFKIHYTLSGADATTKDWADSIAVYAEQCWATVTNLSWATPPPDNNAGGDNRYDIYICNTVSLGYYGSANPESPYSTPYPNGYASWIDVTKDSIAQPFPKYARLRALIAHEFHHACQMRYSWGEAIWIYENTSVYMEDVIYDDVNTLPYRCTLGIDPLDSPHLSITTTTFPYHYAGAIWPTFLHEQFGSSIPRQCWERMGTVAGQNTIPAIDWALQNFASSSLSIALKKYAVWRYFTGTRADAYHFSEGGSWPSSTILRSHSNYPASGNGSPNNPSGPGGTSYIVFTSDSLLLDVSFDGQDGYDWGAYLVGYRNPIQSIEQEIYLNSNGAGSSSITWAGNRHIILVPVVTQWSGTANNLSYTYTATSPYVSVTVSNKVNGILNINSSLTINNQLINSGEQIILFDGYTYPGKTNHERLQGNNKHKDWDGNNQQFRLQENYTVRKENPLRDANFTGLNTVTVLAQLIEGGTASGTVDFKDPWYLADASGSQPNQFFNYSSPHSPTGAYNQSTGGVFLNQGLIPPGQWVPPYYSVRAPQEQANINGFKGFFLNWSGDPNAVTYQNANNRETPIVFKQVKRNYFLSAYDNEYHVQCNIFEF